MSGICGSANRADHSIRWRIQAMLAAFVLPVESALQGAGNYSASLSRVGATLGRQQVANYSPEPHAAGC